MSNTFRKALTDVLADIKDYERVNNLFPNPGKPDCWQSVTRARAALAEQLISKVVAWRVKDFADGWILCHSKNDAEFLSREHSGSAIEPLFSTGGQP